MVLRDGLAAGDALANGRTEVKVEDRTGQKSSPMLSRYRRAARTAAELGLGDLLPLDTAIPELAGLARRRRWPSCCIGPVSPTRQTNTLRKLEPSAQIVATHSR
ncbi:MAG: hypothetical protein L6Q76_08785 [Polyangiaceae bacterium]|nr:hypothetical protein [Polyangiaceae bacterium]